MGSGLPKKAAAKQKRGPVMPRAGKTTYGFEYLTTHICPACQAQIETIGCGYPQHVCSRCSIPMTVKSKKVGN